MITYRNLGADEIPDFPNSISILDLSNNKFYTTIQLTQSLVKLNLSDNEFISIDFNFPLLKELHLSNNKIVNLISLPKNIEILKLDHNKIRILENIPDSVLYLDVSHNKITNIKSLIPNVIIFDCSHNSITNLPKVMKNISELNFSSNSISSLPIMNHKIKKLIGDSPIDNFSNLLECRELQELKIQIGEEVTDPRYENYQKLIGNKVNNLTKNFISSDLVNVLNYLFQIKNSNSEPNRSWCNSEYLTPKLKIWINKQIDDPYIDPDLKISYSNVFYLIWNMIHKCPKLSRSFFRKIKKSISMGFIGRIMRIILILNRVNIINFYIPNINHIQSVILEYENNGQVNIRPNIEILLLKYYTRKEISPYLNYYFNNQMDIIV